MKEAIFNLKKCQELDSGNNLKSGLLQRKTRNL